MNDLIIARKYINLQNSATSRGLEFDLSLTSIKNLLSAKRCYYTGVPLVDVPNHPNQRTIDRVDNTKGYIKGNVVACSNSFNGMKGKLTPEDIKILYTKVCCNATS